MASLVFKHGSYFGVFSVNSRKKWIKIGKVDKREARQILKKLELEFTKDRLNLFEVKPVTLFDYIDRYSQYATTNKAKATCKRELEIIKTIKEYFDDIPLTKIDTELIERFKTKRASDGCKPATVNKELSILRVMLNKALDWHYIKETPKIKLLKLPKTPAKFLTLEEIERLKECATHWLKPILIVMLNTGVRFGELLNLKFDDIDYDGKTLLVRASKTDDFRVLPMTQELYQTLLWLKDNYPLPHMDKVKPRQDCQRVYVFCNLDGNKLKTIRGSFNKACRKAGIKATPYISRHSFASYLVMSGVDLVSVKELLGHSNIKTTMIYAHLSPSYKANTVEKLPWSKPKLEVVK